MTAIQHRRQRRAVHCSSLARSLRRAARAIRDCHHGQVYMWECFYLSNRTVAPQTGPLRWAHTLDGYRLAGSHLPGITADHSGSASE